MKEWLFLLTWGYIFLNPSLFRRPRVEIPNLGSEQRDPNFRPISRSPGSLDLRGNSMVDTRQASPEDDETSTAKTETDLADIKTR